MPVRKAPVAAAATQAAPKTSLPRRSTLPVEEQEETGNENASRADAFDAAAAGGVGIPPGDWEARILEMVYEKNTKGESVKVTYECTTADEESPAYGKKSSQWYSIFDKDGNVGKGVGFLKTDLEKLGVDAEGQKFANLETTLAEITEAQPIVNVKAKQNGQWLNVYLQGLVEDQD